MKNIVLVILVFCTLHSIAEVTKVEFSSRKTILNGKEFGNAGSYELLRGKIYFSFSPRNEYNSRIADLGIAITGSNTLAEASSDIVILKPVDSNKGSKTGLVEVVNEGQIYGPSYFNLAINNKLNLNDPSSFGDGLLMNEGLTMVWVGWQCDLTDATALKLNAPLTRQPNGSTVYGLVRSDWTLEKNVSTLPLAMGRTKAYEAADPYHEANILTVRKRRDDIGRFISRDKWEFGIKTNNNLQPDLNHIFLKEGQFEADLIYELVYVGKDPPVVGLGLAVVRDVMSYMKYDPRCEFWAEKGIALGISQSARFLRQFVYQGFNTDEAGKKVFDGILAIGAGAGRGSFNHRFAQPSRGGFQNETFFYPTDIFPFTGSVQKDELYGFEDGIMSNPWFVEHTPKMIYVNSGYDYWSRAASLIHTTTDGVKDIDPADNERIYHIASAEHAFNDAPSDLSPKASVNYLPNLRATMVHLKKWIVDDIAPPANKIPKIKTQTLVSIEQLNRKAPSSVHTAYRADYGPGWNRGVISFQPPRLRESYVSLVPQVDSVGNEIPGIRNIEISVPLATYNPWQTEGNLKAENDVLVKYYGTFVPLSQEEKEGDQRPSISKLYKNKKEYFTKINKDIDRLVVEGFVLPIDKPYLQNHAQRLWDLSNEK